VAASGVPARHRRYPVWTFFQRAADRFNWTAPTSTEILLVAKAGLAAGIAWGIARAVVGIDVPILAPVTAVLVVQITVRQSVFRAVQRTAGVVIGVTLAVIIGDLLPLNGLTVGLLMAAAMAVAQLVFRLPQAASNQVPISFILVITATSTGEDRPYGRILDTAVGAVVGVVVSALVFPPSRVVDARQTLGRLGTAVAEVLEAMAAGLVQPWSNPQTHEWRRRARVARTRLTDAAIEAVGTGREAAQWNIRDRRNAAVLARYEVVAARLERAALGVSAISRGLDDAAFGWDGDHPAMPGMAALLHALGGAIRALTLSVEGADEQGVADAISRVNECRRAVARAATRRAREAAPSDGSLAEALPPVAGGEWLSYAALLVQVDRIVEDLTAPLPE
jgi:uncharacterized membrane protein YgaE (UPF0421/DUF939 family)